MTYPPGPTGRPGPQGHNYPPPPPQPYSTGPDQFSAAPRKSPALKWVLLGVVVLVALAVAAGAVFYLARDRGATEASQGWQAIEDELRLSGWSRARRVVVLRRRIKRDIALTAKHKGKTELQEFFASISNPEKPRPDLETVLDILDGWEGVDQKFSKENVEILLENYVGAHIAILNAYSTGYFEAKEKN